MCSSLATRRRSGFGAARLAREATPLPLATSKSLPSGDTRTLVGYHPTGMNPFETLRPGSETSRTAKLLLSALAT